MSKKCRRKLYASWLRIELVEGKTMDCALHMKKLFVNDPFCFVNAKIKKC